MGEKEKFMNDLFETKSDSLAQYAYRLIGDWGLAEDLVQRTFAVLFLRIYDVFYNPEPVKWLYKTLFNIYRNELTRKHFLSEVPFEGEDLISSFFVQELENKDSLFEILPAGLSKEETQILQWHFGDRLSYREIAERLGVGEVAARKRLSRALRLCRKKIEEI
ncbi:MAG: sigma-70 family RNA polymerase sigma factor [Clostridiales bacterium]|nr:sigma-70 family RNA polymerase sigma factor [Clostridiales bacterium]